MTPRFPYPGLGRRWFVWSSRLVVDPIKEGRWNVRQHRQHRRCLFLPVSWKIDGSETSSSSVWCRSLCSSPPDLSSALKEDIDTPPSYPRQLNYITYKRDTSYPILIVDSHSPGITYKFFSFTTSPQRCLSSFPVNDPFSTPAQTVNVVLEGVIRVPLRPLPPHLTSSSTHPRFETSPPSTPDPSYFLSHFVSPPTCISTRVPPPHFCVSTSNLSLYRS